MKNFRMFDVYLGTQNRKEDFFTYFLASCLDYCHQNYETIFQDIMREVIGVDVREGQTVKLADGNQIKKLVSKEFFNELLLCFGVEDDASILPQIMREFPLPKSNTTKNEKYFLDLAFFISDPKPIFVGIEGKVFDKSVRQNQLSNYYRSIKEFLQTESRTSRPVEVQLFLLSTYKENNDKSSKALNRDRKT